MILCTRTVDVPGPQRERFLDWIASNREVRERHGILFEAVLTRDIDSPVYTVITAWPSHDVFDSWIATPERARITASDVHQSVVYGRITRHEFAGGYFNLDALRKSFAEETEK